MSKIKTRNYRYFVNVVNEFTGRDLEHFYTDSLDDAKTKLDTYKRVYAKDVTDYKKKRIASDYMISLIDYKDQANNIYCHIYTDHELNVKLEQCA